MALRGGCPLCRDPVILRALGVQRRRRRAWRPAALAAILLFMMLTTLDDDPDIRQPTIIADGDARGVDVVVQPGRAAIANFTDGEAGKVEVTPGRTNTPQGIYWDVVLPPVALLAGLGARAAWIALASRRLDLIEPFQRRRLDDRALARIVTGRVRAVPVGLGEPWLDGIARRLNFSDGTGTDGVACTDGAVIQPRHVKMRKKRPVRKA